MCFRCVLPVEVFPEGPADPVECDGVRTGVQVAQAEADDAEVVPESVVRVLSVRMEVKEEHEHVRRQEANGEDDDEHQHGHGHLLPRPYLPRRSSRKKFKKKY